MKTKICPHCGGIMRWNYVKNAWVCPSCNDSISYIDWEKGQARLDYPWIRQ